MRTFPSFPNMPDMEDHGKSGHIDMWAEACLWIIFRWWNWAKQIHNALIMALRFHSAFCRGCWPDEDDFAWDFHPALCRTLLRVRGLEMVLRHDRQCTWVRGRRQWEVLWGRTSCYTKKLMTVLLYIMDSIFRWTFVPLAWLHCARGQQPRHYVLNIEILEHQGKCNLRCILASA